MAKPVAGGQNKVSSEEFSGALLVDQSLLLKWLTLGGELDGGLQGAASGGIGPGAEEGQSDGVPMRLVGVDSVRSG